MVCLVDDPYRVRCFLARTMSKYSEILDEKINVLCDTMQPTKVIQELLKRRYFDDIDKQKVMNETTDWDKNVRIVDILQGRGFDAFCEFIRSLTSIGGKHLDLAEDIQPVRYRVLWYAASPAYGASVVHVLEEHATAAIFSSMKRVGDDQSLIMRRARIFKKEYSKKELEQKSNEDATDLVRDSHAMEVCLVFPTDVVCGMSALEELVRQQGDLFSDVKFVVMSGPCHDTRESSGCGLLVSKVTGVEEGEQAPAGFDEIRSSIACIREPEAKLEMKECIMKREDGTEEEELVVPFDSNIFNFYSFSNTHFQSAKSLVCLGPENLVCLGPTGDESEEPVTASEGGGNASACVLMNIIKYDSEHLLTH